MQAALRRPLAPFVLEAWSDAAHLARMGGMPTVGLRSGAEDVAHSDNEYAEIRRLSDGTVALAVLLFDLLKS